VDRQEILSEADAPRDALLSRTVASDELDEDPSEPELDGAGVGEAIALDERQALELAARKAGMLEAAAYAESNWSVTHVAQGIREKAARL
jgi:hypothetical protein